MIRIFPNPTQTEQRDFIRHSCLLEGIPMSEDIIDRSMSEEKDGNPFATGHFAACNLVVTNAHRVDLLPRRSASISDSRGASISDSRGSTLSEEILRDKRGLFCKIHKALMEPVAKNGPKGQGYDTIEHYQIGTLRRRPKKIGDRTMPDPGAVQRLLDKLIIDIAEFHDKHYDRLNASNIDWNEIQGISDQIWEFHLRLICIKPFEDGSNRVARLFLNLMRLNFGLCWYVPESDEKAKKAYLKDIWRVQDEMKKASRM